MEKLALKYTSVLKAHAQFIEIIDDYKTLQAKTTPEKMLDIYRDSVIKRFEFCYDITWKYLKLYLEEKYGIEVASPKMTFHEALKQKILNNEQTALALAMVDNRNETSHTYNEDMADNITGRAQDYYDFMQTIATRCKP